MAMRHEDFFKVLVDRGYTLQRISGSHFIFRSGKNDIRRTFPVVVHGREVRADIVDAVLRLVDMTEEEYRERCSAIPRQSKPEITTALGAEPLFSSGSPSDINRPKSSKKSRSKKSGRVATTSDPNAGARYEQQRKMEEERRAERIAGLRKRAAVLLESACGRIYAGEQQQVAREITAFIRECVEVSFGDATGPDHASGDDGGARSANAADAGAVDAISSALSSLTVCEVDTLDGDPRLMFDLSFIAIVAWIEDHSRMLDETEKKVALIVDGLDVFADGVDDFEEIDREGHRRYVAELLDEVDKIDFECVDFGVLLKTLKHLERRHWRYSNDVAALRSHAMKQLCTLHYRAYVECRRAIGNLECFSFNTSSKTGVLLVDFDRYSACEMMDGTKEVDPLWQRSTAKKDSGTYLLMKLADILLDEIPSGMESEILRDLESAILDALSRQVFGYCPFPDGSTVPNRRRSFELLQRLLKPEAFRDGLVGRSRYLDALQRFVLQQEAIALWFTTNTHCGDHKTCTRVFCHVRGNVNADLRLAANKIRAFSQIMDELISVPWHADVISPYRGPNASLIQFCQMDFHMMLRPFIVDGLEKLRRDIPTKKLLVIGTIIGEFLVAVSSGYSFALHFEDEYGFINESFRELRETTLSLFITNFFADPRLFLAASDVIDKHHLGTGFVDKMYLELYFFSMQNVIRGDAPETSIMDIDFNDADPDVGRRLQSHVRTLVIGAADAFHCSSISLHEFRDAPDFDTLQSCTRIFVMSNVNLASILEFHGDGSPPPVGEAEVR